MMNLANKTVVLTGASGGMGQSIAAQLAAQGAKLVMVGRNEDALKEILTKLQGSAQHHCSLTLDIGNETGINELVEFCQGMPGGIDILINNAGLSDFNLHEDSSYKSINDLFSVNLVAPIALAARLLPLLREKSEALIVNIGSVLGAIGNPGFANYCASKAGLARFSEALRRELSDSTVKVLHLNPRATATKMNNDSVNELNQTLGISTDAPDKVAQILIHKIQRNDYGESSIGWPEKLYIKINALIPGLVDNSFSKNLPLIKQTAKTQQGAPLEDPDGALQQITP